MTTEAIRRAAGPQPLWASVPPPARARYLRRAAQAILDEVDELADLLAAEAGMPRTEALLAELLPSVAGLHELADDGPRALADRRLGRASVLRGGRRAFVFQAPLGVVGIRGGAGSPWAENVLEAAAALLAGNGVVLAPPVEAAGRRLVDALGRAGLPDGLLEVVAADATLQDCDAVVETGAPGPKGTMLVLDGAPLDRTASGALWAAFAHGGHGTASVGRIVTVPGATAGLLRGLEAGAARSRSATRATRPPRSARSPPRRRSPPSRRSSARPSTPAPYGCAAARSAARSTPPPSCAASRPARACSTNRCPARSSPSSRRAPRPPPSSSPQDLPPPRCGLASAPTASASRAHWAPS